MLALPFTSFPLVAKFTGSSMVAPLSLLPLVALIAVWWVPALIKGERLAPQATPLLALVMVALLVVGAIAVRVVTASDQREARTLAAGETRGQGGLDRGVNQRATDRGNPDGGIRGLRGTLE